MIAALYVLQLLGLVGIVVGLGWFALGEWDW